MFGFDTVVPIEAKWAIPRKLEVHTHPYYSFPRRYFSSINGPLFLLAAGARIGLRLFGAPYHYAVAVPIATASALNSAYSSHPDATKLLAHQHREKLELLNVAVTTPDTEFPQPQRLAYSLLMPAAYLGLSAACGYMPGGDDVFQGKTEKGLFWGGLFTAAPVMIGHTVMTLKRCCGNERAEKFYVGEPNPHPHPPGGPSGVNTIPFEHFTLQEQLLWIDPQLAGLPILGFSFARTIAQLLDASLTGTMVAGGAGSLIFSYLCGHYLHRTDNIQFIPDAKEREELAAKGVEFRNPARNTKSKVLMIVDPDVPNAEIASIKLRTASAAVTTAAACLIAEQAEPETSTLAFIIIFGCLTLLFMLQSVFHRMAR